MISPKDLASIRLRFAEEPHGTRHRYLGGCGCVPCRAANSRYSSERGAAQRAGDWRGLVPATLVLGHIQKLRKAGIGYRAIAAAAGLAKSTMAMILTGERAQIRKHDADRILAVDRRAVADGALVPAGRTWALLNELLEAHFELGLCEGEWANGRRQPPDRQPREFLARKTQRGGCGPARRPQAPLLARLPEAKREPP
jgi:hypothetical protein